MKNKNIDEFTGEAKCYECKINGLYCYTPQGADYYTCPLCENHDFFHGSFENKLWNKYFGDDIYDKIYKIYGENLFCSNCKIIFSIGCVHGCNGCTDDCYNGHFIGKYKHNNIEYIGMPCFDSIDEWYNEIKNIEILEWICPNNNSLFCDKAYYPKTKYSQYYKKCELQQNIH